MNYNVQKPPREAVTTAAPGAPIKIRGVADVERAIKLAQERTARRAAK